MLTLIAFLLTLIGSVNWLLIGLLQYDFVAGIFGYQASMFSRIIYIVIGAASVFLVFKIIKNKGVLPIWTRRNRKDLAKNIEKMKHKQDEPMPIHNVESGKELDLSRFEEHPPYNEMPSHQPKGLFDEHFEDRK
ncbi:MAG: DUF378 domain-containing protein [Clostridia bacterium]|nr:DUF378 domain-containing protein [Clostridia bacterium]